MLGSQIAFQSAFKGKNVVVYDISEDVIKNAKSHVASWDDSYKTDMNATDEQLKETHARIKFSYDLAEAVKRATWLCSKLINRPLGKCCIKTLGMWSF